MFGDVSFNALLAVDDPSAMSLVRQPGSDGFRLDSTAMFQVLFLFDKLHLQCIKHLKIYSACVTVFSSGCCRP